MTKFNELPILVSTKEALMKLGFEFATPIQALTIPKMIEGLDLIGQAQTGTGKTFAFAIPMVEKIDSTKASTQGLILAPTRELTIQVYKEILKLIRFYPELSASLIVGGTSYDRQFRELAKKPHIIVATPGRMIDHINRGTVDLSNVGILTIDEADEMLKMGFQEDVETILNKTPASRQTVMFSATMPPFIKRIAREYQRNPELIKVQESLTVDKTVQGYFLVKESDKLKLLKRILDFENKTAIIFCNTKADVDRVALALQEEDYLADAIHGDLKQAQRNYVMNRFRNKQISVLIATDVAARGLDISDLEIVINYDLPDQNEIYVHRIGRTGRAGKKGMAISFVTPRKRAMIENLSKFTKAEIKKLEMPSSEEIYYQRLNSFKENLKESLNEETPNHLASISDLVDNDLDKDLLLNLLLDNIIPKYKSYSEIEVIRNKKPRERRSARDYKGERQVKYKDYILNLGKKDGMTPQNLFRIMDKEFGIYSKNIGDIKFNSRDTVFGLKSSSTSRLKKDRRFKYNGKDVYIIKR